MAKLKLPVEGADVAEDSLPLDPVVGEQKTDEPAQVPVNSKRVQVTRDGGSGAVHNGRGQKFERGATVRIPEDVDADVAALWIERRWAEPFG
jgi:ssDNA-binding replication factor A large subunit